MALPSAALSAEAGSDRALCKTTPSLGVVPESAGRRALPIPEAPDYGDLITPVIERGPIYRATP